MAGVRQFKQSLDPYDGLAQSVVTSKTMFWGDAAMITGSLTTVSGTASKWTVEGYEGDNTAGFTTALPAASAAGWQPLKVISAQGYFSMDTIGSWARILRTPSNSSATLFLSVFVGS